MEVENTSVNKSPDNGVTESPTKGVGESPSQGVSESPAKSVSENQDTDITVTNVSEGSSDFVRIKQEVDLPEDDTYYPMDFGISVEDDEETNPVYVKMKNKEGASSGTKPGIEESKSQEEEDDDEDDSEMSEGESEGESDEDSSNSRGEASGEEADNTGWSDGLPTEETQHPSTSGETMPTLIDGTPIVIKEEPISDDEGLSYQKVGEQYAENYNMLESLRRVCTGDEGEDTGQASQGLSYPKDGEQFAESYRMLESLRRESNAGEDAGHSTQGHMSDSGDDDLFGQDPENFSMMSPDQGKQHPFIGRLGTKSHHLMDDKDASNKCENSDISVKPLQNLHLDQTMGMAGSSFTCDLCQKPCGNRANFIVHLRMKHAEELPHECGICEVRFSTDKMLEDHVLIQHTGEAQHLYNCDVCGARFKQKYILHAHMLTHNEYSPFACNMCTKTFLNSTDLKHHLFSQHQTNSFPCPKCNRVYRLKGYLKLHMKNYHDRFVCESCSKEAADQGGLDDIRPELDRTSPSREICTEQDQEPTAKLQQLSCKICGVAFENLSDSAGHQCKVYCCSICSKDFSSSSALDPHGQPDSSRIAPVCDSCRKAVISDDGEKQEESTSAEEEETIQCKVCLKRFPRPIIPHVKGSSQRQERFACRFCGNTYHRKSSLLKHVRVHERERKYMCSVCNLIFTKRKVYRRHMKVHTKPFKCFKCDKRFSKEKHLVKHHRLHSNVLDKNQICQVCGRRFARRKNLVNHLKSHEKKKHPELYTCIKCFKSFPLKDLLIEHLKIHEAKPDTLAKYTCDVCRLPCVNELHLTNHKKIHAGAKLNVCDICGEAFNRRYDLIEHRELAHGQFICKVCGRAFPTTDELEEHNKEIHGGGNLVCDICDRVCVNKLHLQNHILIHTGTKICVCDYCGHGFANRYDLVKHMESHTGQKPHNCDICNEGFSETADLIIHRKTHPEAHPGLVIGDVFIKKEIEDTTE